MLLFEDNQSLSICVKTDNPYVLLAVEDLRADFLRVSHLSVAPTIVGQEEGGCLIIEDNPCKEDPLQDESFKITCDGKRIAISANTYLGTLWGLYTFSEKILGVQPCYLFNDLAIKKKSRLEVQPFTIEEEPQRKGFRGVFINDEDLLTGWKESGGVRPIDYPWYQTTVAQSVMDKVVETALRLKINLVIPASFLDIDNPPEKALADCVARRGIFLSQHHIEPLGLSHFTFDGYCKRFEKQGGCSFIHNPDTLIEAWEYYAEKWAQYDNVVWQIGLRGKADRPVWEEEKPTEKELEKYADYINSALKKQKEIVLQATKGKAKYFTTTLWMEGSLLMEKGLLNFGEDVIAIFSDNGPNQMFGKEYDLVPRREKASYGIYYHLQYHDIGPHLAPQTGLNKLYYNLKKAQEKGDDRYCILNVGNVREFDFELKAYSQMLWNMDGFSVEGFLDEYASLYGAQAEQSKAFVRAYFNNLPSLETEYLRYVHAQYFNYNYDEPAIDGVKNFVLKDEMIVVKGAEIVWLMQEKLPSELYGKMYAELKKAVPIYEELSTALEKWAVTLPQALQRHVTCKWWLYSKTLLHFYRWYVNAYEAKQSYDNGEKWQDKLNEACEVLEEYLSLRKRAEYGEFENWYKEDTKVHVVRRLLAARELLKKNS